VVECVDGVVLWGNLYLLFWLSLFLFSIVWVDELLFVWTLVVVYGVNLLFVVIVYYVL